MAISKQFLLLDVTKDQDLCMKIDPFIPQSELSIYLLKTSKNYCVFIYFVLPLCEAIK